MKRLVVNKKSIAVFFLIFFLMKPVGMDGYNQILNMIFNIAKFVSMFFSVVMWFKKKYKKNKSLLYIASIALVTVAVTLINWSSPYDAIIYWGTVISMILYAELYSGESIIKFIDIVYYVFLLYVLINFITLFAWPGGYEGRTNFYFLGNKVMQVLYVLPMLILLLIRKSVCNKSKMEVKDLLIFFVCAYTFYKCPSSTSIIAFVIVLAYYLFFYQTKIMLFFSKISMRIIFVCILCINVVLLAGNTVPIIGDAMSVVFGKDGTFTGRTYIWEKAIAQFLNKPMGSGWNEFVYNVHMLNYWNQAYIDASHAHDLLLNISLKSGLIATVLYILLMFSSCRYLDSVMVNQKHSVSLKCTMMVYIFVFLIISIVESYPTNCAGLWLMIYLSSRYYDIEKNIKIIK